MSLKPASMASSEGNENAREGEQAAAISAVMLYAEAKSRQWLWPNTAIGNRGVNGGRHLLVRMKKQQLLSCYVNRHNVMQLRFTDIIGLCCFMKNQRKVHDELILTISRRYQGHFANMHEIK